MVVINKKTTKLRSAQQTAKLHHNNTLNQAVVLLMNNSIELPRVWLIDSYRAGERVQLQALAEALGWPFEVKTLSYRKTGFRTSLLRRSDLRGIDVERSSSLVPPWPDLVLSAGMRNEPVCRWIRQQARGHTVIVNIGRPWAALSEFDLVITTPQYRLPRQPNVLHNLLTLHRVTGERLDNAARRWQPRFAQLALPRPYIAVIMGGNSGPYTLGPKAVARLADQAGAMARQQGGSLLITSSARTPPAAAHELGRRISVPMHFYHWRPDDKDNPSYAYLALADAFIVTAESISMLSEASATGKPVYLFDIGAGPAADNDFRLAARLYQWMMRWGPQRLTRDISLIHRPVIESGHAVWLGDTFPDGSPPPLQDLSRAVASVRALVCAKA
jgi:mitochondrial fission protein ELM1